MAELQERFKLTSRYSHGSARRRRTEPKLKTIEDMVAYSVSEVVEETSYALTPTHFEEGYASGRLGVMQSSGNAGLAFTQAVEQFGNLRHENIGYIMPGKRIARLWPVDHRNFDAIRVRSSLEEERSELGFDQLACSILGRIYDLGHASCDDLKLWIETADEWIAFSRLQRARLVFDSGSEFTVSREGREFVQRMLGGGAA